MHLHCKIPYFLTEKEFNSIPASLSLTPVSFLFSANCQEFREFSLVIGSVNYFLPQSSKIERSLLFFRGVHFRQGLTRANASKVKQALAQCQFAS